MKDTRAFKSSPELQWHLFEVFENPPLERMLRPAEMVLDAHVSAGGALLFRCSKKLCIFVVFSLVHFGIMLFRRHAGPRQTAAALSFAHWSRSWWETPT